MNFFGLLYLPFVSCAYQFTLKHKRAQVIQMTGARAALIEFISLNKQKALLSEQARKLLIDEAKQWDVSSFGDLALTPDKTVLLDKDSAVGRVQWFGENNQITDMYFYLEADSGGWKISTMRLLALTGIIEDLFLALKAKPALTPEETAMLRNSELTLAHDKKLKEWFVINRNSLDKLRQLIQTKAGSEAQFINNQNTRFPEVARALKILHVSGASIAKDSNIGVVIDGMTDNTVGFMYSPKKNPPLISPDSYIWVEEVADGWYLFRTI